MYWMNSAPSWIPGDKGSIGTGEGLWAEPSINWPNAQLTPKTNGREPSSPAERHKWLPLLDAVRTWCASPSLAVRQQFATIDAMKRLVPDLGMSLTHGDGWRSPTP